MMRVSFSAALSLLTGGLLLVSCGRKPEAAPAAASGKAPEADLTGEAAGPAPDPAPAPMGTGQSEAAGEKPEAATPLGRFKKEMASIKAFMEANQQSPDAAVALANTRELIRRAGAVSTEGLPEDLASAYKGMNAVMQRLQTTLDDLPVPVDQLEAYLEQEKAKGGAPGEKASARMEAFTTAMNEIGEESRKASGLLKEATAKYGIEFLDLGGN